MQITDQIKNGFLNNEFNIILKELYFCSKQIELQKKRYVNALCEFENLYGVKPVEIYSAPGRTEIGGNHTDHQNGKVLAASVNLDAIAVVSKRADNIIHIKSEGYQPFDINISDLHMQEDEEGTTQSLVRGVANGVSKRGYKVGGFEAYITSDVLSGSGLSSSAAYEVLIGNIFSGLYNEGSIDAVAIAQIGQEAEMNYFGKPCGLMDQMACSVGGMIFIDFADKNCPQINQINVDFNSFGHCLCIVDTKGSHADLTDEYAAVPREMKNVANYFDRGLLSQVDKESFFESISDIREVAGDRAVLRALHWFAENDRVDALVSALEKNNFEGFKQSIKESGDSSFKFLQNVFSTKNVREQGVSIALALSDLILKEKGVSRVHGGGFAGTIQAFVPIELVQEYKQFIEKVYGKDSCYVLSIRPIGGKKIV